MKIAIISPWAVSDTAVGGTERFVIDLAEALNKIGNKVDVYMLSGKSYEKYGINYINLNISGTGDYIEEQTLEKIFGDFSNEECYTKMANILEKLIDMSEYDLIQLNSQLFLKAFKDKKRIFTIHTNPFEFSMNFGKNGFEYMLKVMQEEYNNNTFFVAPSKYYAKIYKDLTNINIDFIPHAIRINRIIKDVNKSNIYDKYKIDGDFKHILLPSRLEPIQKQPMIFMKAFSKIDREIINKFQVICTGLDEQYKKYAFDIENFCQKNGINLKILRFDYMYEAYSIADLVVLPSQSESFGYSALESLSIGKPTILNAIPTYLEIAEGSQNSYIFNKTEEDLLNELNKVLKTKLEIKKQTIKWQEKYNLDTFGKHYLEVINKESR